METDTGEQISENDYQKEWSSDFDDKLAKIKSYAIYGAIGLVTASLVYTWGVKPLIDFNKTSNLENKVISEKLK